MLLEIGKEKWKLHFKTVDTPDNALWDREIHVYVHSGICVMTYVQPAYCINGVRGVAKCSRKDQFSRRVGNRLALTKAIAKLPLETRTAIWDAYWKRVRRPKESSLSFQARLAATPPPAPQASA